MVIYDSIIIIHHNNFGQSHHHILSIDTNSGAALAVALFTSREYYILGGSKNGVDFYCAGIVSHSQSANSESYQHRSIAFHFTGRTLSPPFPPVFCSTS
jgi:hypothetical protein